MGRMAQTYQEQEHFKVIYNKIDLVIASPIVALSLFDGGTLSGRIKSISVQPQELTGDLVFEGAQGPITVDYLDIADIG